MKRASTRGPQVNFKVRKEPFGLRLSFDKLRANGSGEPTVVHSRNGPRAGSDMGTGFTSVSGDGGKALGARGPLSL